MEQRINSERKKEINDMAKVGVIGAGSWGIALAKLLRTNGNEVTVWSIVEEEVAMLQCRMRWRM